MNIKSGFKTTGLWPLNLNWLNDNRDKLRLVEKSPLEKFDRIIKSHIANTSNSFGDMVKNLDYLYIEQPKISRQYEEGNLFKKVLSHLYDEAEAHVDDIQKKGRKQKKSQLGESYSAPKILNDNERLEKLDEMNEKKKVKAFKTSKESSVTEVESKNTKLKANEKIKSPNLSQTSLASSPSKLLKEYEALLTLSEVAEDEEEVDEFLEIDTMKNSKVSKPTSTTGRITRNTGLKREAISITKVLEDHRLQR